MWNAPASVFESFKKDSLGKCEVCFRAGFCSMNECSVQKKFEIAVINSTVDKAKLNGFYDDKPMKDMLKKIIKNKKVDFKKIAKKVTKNLKKAKKFANKKAEKKLINAVRILNGGKVKGKKAKIGKKGLSSSKLIDIIRSSLRTFRANVSICLSQKSKFF
jgi:arsenate reductase-like glutaredoxin family protein